MLRVEPKQLDTLLHPQFDTEALEAAEVIGKGLAASPGAACGQVVFTAEDAAAKVESKEMPKVVLVRLETSPEDIEGMQVSQGILTVRGGMTSHAAVVARGMGTCCVSGCGDDQRGLDRLRRQGVHHRRPDLQRGRLDLHRRFHRQHLRRGVITTVDATEISGDLRPVYELGRRAPSA